MGGSSHRYCVRKTRLLRIPAGKPDMGLKNTCDVKASANFLVDDDVLKVSRAKNYSARHQHCTIDYMPKMGNSFWYRTTPTKRSLQQPQGLMSEPLCH